MEETSALRTLSLGAAGSQISGYSPWGLVPVLCETRLLFYLGVSWGSVRTGGLNVGSPFLLRELVVLTGPQGVKDQRAHSRCRSCLSGKGLHPSW